MRLENLFLNSANGRPLSLKRLLTCMKEISTCKRKLHLQLLPDAIKSMPIDGIPIREVTRMQTICDILNNQPTLKIFIIEVNKQLKLCLTIPVTTASTERNFSALKCLKTFLSNLMKQEHLNHYDILI